jgi:sulfate adenylyltransferase subunit 1
VRPQTNDHHDFRGFAGRVAAGVFKPGDEVMALPSGFTSRVKTIQTFEGPVEEAFHPMSVALTLEDEIDISRGDTIAKPNNLPETAQDLDLMICWFSEKPLQPNGKYVVRHTTREVRCLVKDLQRTQTQRRALSHLPLEQLDGDGRLAVYRRRKNCHPVHLFFA